MSVNEFDLIERMFSRLTGDDDSVRCGIGDDAAIVGLPDDNDLVVTTDTLVSGVHFFPEADPHAVGFKSLAVNLSDMAAMAARPRWVTLSLTLPDTDMDWITAFTRGFAELARRYNISLVGGDTTRGPLSITCQLRGTVPAGRGVRRRGAAPGDLVYVSGRLGLAAMALRLLGPDGANTRAVPAVCMERLLRPVPRVELGMLLSDTASAMIDLSDGLAGDLGHILAASGTGAEVRLDNLPIDESSGGFSEMEIRQLAAVGGDDYELCFTVPEDRLADLDNLSMRMDCPLTQIGRITEGSGIKWLDADGNDVALTGESYQHF